MYFESNCQALLSTHAQHAATVDQLRAVSPITEFELNPCPDGGYTLLYRGVALHDPQGPLSEAEAVIAQQATLVADRVHVVLGLGLGYLLEALSEKSPGQMVVYEPDAALLRFVLENVDLAHLLSLPRVALFCDQQDFLLYLRKKLYSQYKLDILTLRGSAALLAQEIQPLMEQITRMELFRVQDFKTGQHFHQKWIQQFFGNAPNFAAMPTLDDLVDSFTDKPALVISRGPSLDAALPWVRALADAVVLIAVGGALHRLHDHGITPDFALFYDANGMKEQVHGLPDAYLEQITFVMSPFTQPAVFDMPSRGKLLMLAQNNMQFVDFLDEALQRKHCRLGGGGTVSIIGFQMAQRMGCNPIALVGQDLAFPHNQVYAGGVAMRLNEKGQLDLEASESLYTAPYDLTTVPGQDGKPLPTLQSYQSFLIHLEEMAALNAKSERPAQLWNASLGGAHIEGFPLLDLQRWVGQWPCWKQPHALSQPPAWTAEAQQGRAKSLNKAIQDLQVELIGHIRFLKEQGRLAGRNQSDLRKLANLTLGVNQAIYTRFSEAPFAAYLLIHEMRAYREQFQETLTLPDGPLKAQKVIKTFCQSAASFLEEQILPTVRQASELCLSRARGNDAPADPADPADDGIVDWPAQVS
ncbi:motility associated factor glycosyltransferase family protein [Vampirovibrio chlorellavorus]|uniref:motility associated factor glycosyltransferase family protein n=1 Tax=Vampirovibrio chlorellavorus TaxID=758823 RepID=UPI0026E92B8A|nr:6-hydroxymethylpterin diphosphokinase MptE-like protein [Vampirovibrio chlorellavorus]